MDNGASSYRRFLKGEKEAFGELITLYRERLILFINRYVNNLSEAEELAQDSFVELIVHPHRYNFRSSLKTYLFSVARNKAVDHLRRQKGAKPLEESDAVSDLEEDFFQTEQKRILYRALSTLPADYQTALYLVYMEEMTYRDAAAVMKKTLKQTENLVYRAKKSLKEKLIQEGYDAQITDGV